MKKNHLIVAAILGTASLFFTSCESNDNKEETTGHHANGEEHKEGDAHSTETSAMKNKMATGNAMMQSMNGMMDNMKAMKMTGDFDLDFANMMIEHHKGAVDMSELELKSGSDEKMKAMAQNIITAQKGEIEEMEAFIKTHEAAEAKENHSEAHEHGQGEHNEMQEGMKAMMDKSMAMKMTDNTDKDFAMMMVMHHQSAVDMAKNELSHGKHLEIKKMAQKMITDQNKGIAEFQSWLSKN